MIRPSEASERPAAGRGPLHFGSATCRLFGFYDPPENKGRSAPATVLCYPMGQEYVRAHRSFVQLSRRLARRGIPALRFDYSGCGDSEGRPDEVGLSRWVDDVDRAIDEARRLSGCGRVRVVGLRLGAALALLAAARRDDVDALVLWAPVVDGARHVGELQDLNAAFLRFAYVGAPATGPSGSPDEILGFPFPAALGAELAALDLRGLDGRIPPDILLVQAGRERGVRELEASLEAAGARVDRGPDRDREIWLAAPYQGLVASGVVDAIVAWLSRLRS